MDHPTADTPMVDALIVGGGPAGLAAATYLGRFRRRAVVFDAGGARALLIPVSHNCPGFPEGITGADLMARLSAQARRYGADIRRGRVERLTRHGDLFAADVPEGRLLARKVILATGVVDGAPPIAGWEQAVRQGLVRICPVCDAYEVIDRPVAVLGQGRGALREAIFLSHYTPHVFIISMAPSAVPEALRRKAEAAEIEVLDAVAVEPTDGGFLIAPAAGEERRVDAIYAAMGCRAESRLAGMLEVACSGDGSILADAHLETNVPGVYAIGDVVEALNQIAVSFGHAALAATHIHNTLRGAPSA